MSTKVNQMATSATDAVTPERFLEDFFRVYPNITIRKLAHSLEVSYTQLLKASKAPQPGVPYDPEATNFAAMATLLAKLDANFSAVDWDAVNTGSTKATLVKDHSAFTVGAKVYLRRNNHTPYTILYKTDSHIVFMLDGTTEPLSWAINTFMLNGPVFEPRKESVKAE